MPLVVSSSRSFDAGMLGERFDRALLRAADLHRHQVRKATQVPYVSHLLAVCALALEFGADEDEAIAALLHDAVEDQGGPATAAATSGSGVTVAVSTMRNCGHHFTSRRPSTSDTSMLTSISVT